MLRFNESRCDYEKRYEGGPSWCLLGDNICFKETGDCDEWNELVQESE